LTVGLLFAVMLRAGLALGAVSAAAAPLYNLTGKCQAHARLALGLLIAVCGLVGLIALPAASLAAGNANFVGHWENGYWPWTITSENFATGECVGTSPGFVLTGCKVTGDAYVFTVETEGGGYKSFNEGTIEGNKAIGTFYDPGATPYTATRESAGQGVVKGEVLDERKLPAPGVTLTLVGTSDEGKAVLQSAKSDAKGAYSIEAPAGTYVIAASGDVTGQNGGGLAVKSEKGTPECTGTAKQATCELVHIGVGEEGKANFTYTYCASTERLPKGKPPTGCPIIFIPGTLGSRILCGSRELWTALPSPGLSEMDLEPNGETNAPGSCSSQADPIGGQEGVVKTAGPKNIYGSLLEFLNRIESRGGAPAPENGAYAFPYDWRKSPLITLPALNAEVDDVLAKTGAARVVLMAHSMGGLVAEAYVAESSYAEKVARVITLGTPYWGAPKSHTALMAGKSGEPKAEPWGLDLFINAQALQMAARNWLGLYWLYPSTAYGPWLKIDGRGYAGAKLGGTQIDPWVASLGGTTALVDAAMAGHSRLDGFQATNGVPYQVVVGSGLPTLTSEEVAFNEFQKKQDVRVWFGPGDGTVPAISATQGESEGRPLPGAYPPIAYVCNIEHVALPGNTEVQGLIEGFLMKGEPVQGAATCSYTGIETELVQLAIANHGAHASAAALPAVNVKTAAGTIPLEQAFNEGLVQIMFNAGNTVVVTDNHDPVTLEITGKGIGLKLRSLTSAGSGTSKGSGPARYYGPLSGAVTITGEGAVQSNGKPVKTVTAGRAPHTTAHVTRRGRLYLVRLTAKGAAAIYVKIGKASSKLYSRPLKLTKAQLKSLRFASVDQFGDWESPEKARIPR
jgi:pimeloyl-ACP methyl ester carboxylesterase